MKYWLIPLIFFVYSLPWTCRAAGCNFPQTKFFFGNGMFTSRSSAEKSGRELQGTLIKNGILKHDQIVAIAYNLNEFALIQLLQVTSQKREEYGRRFWSYLSNLSLASDEFRAFAFLISRSFDYQRYIRDNDLNLFVHTFASELDLGKSILIVSHSQGNFYSNASWYQLDSLGHNTKNVALVGAAVPASEIAGGGGYCTLTQDIVMKYIPGALRGNATNSKATKSGHDFIADYLGGNESQPMLLAEIERSLKKIRTSSSETQDLNDALYVHSSLIPFWSYVRRVKRKPVPLSHSQCLAMASFAKTYDWWGETCEERSLDRLIPWMNECFKTEWSRKDKFDYGRCSLLGDPSMIDPGFGSTVAFDFIPVDHPECVWHGIEVNRNITPAVLGEAIKLLGNQSP